MKAERRGSLTHDVVPDAELCFEVVSQIQISRKILIITSAITK